MDLFAELTRVLAAFERQGIRYALCGGLAVVVHGAPRATKDIDVLVAPEDVPAVSDMASALGFPSRGPPFRFRQTGIVVHRFTKVVGELPLVLDVLVAEERLRPALDRVVARTVGGVTLRVLRIDDLRAMKSDAGRPQDLADLERLKDVHDEP